jgi:hypothetical protein
MKKTIFYKSFKALDRTFSTQILFDLLFYGSLAIIFIGTMLLMQQNFYRLNDIIPILTEMQGFVATNFETMPSQALLGKLENVKGLFTNVLTQAGILILVALALIMLSSTFLKGLVWNKIKKEVSDKAFFKRYAQMNYLFFFLFVLLVIFTVLLVKQELLMYYLIAEFLLYLHTKTVTNVLFHKKHKVWKSIGKGFIYAFKKLHYFLLYYLFPAFIVLVLIVVLRLLGFLPRSVFYIVAALLFLLFAGWLRIYLHMVVQKILHNEMP